MLSLALRVSHNVAYLTAFNVIHWEAVGIYRVWSSLVWGDSKLQNKKKKEESKRRCYPTRSDNSPPQGVTQLPARLIVLTPIVHAF